MNTKTVLFIIIVTIILAAGGYYAYQTYAGGEQKAEQQATTEQVQAQDVTIGEGATASAGTIVSVLYTGRLADGTVFDSSEAHGNEPLVFQLGSPGIIAGFQIGVNGMKEGGERVMQIPPTLGYGGEDVKNPVSGAVIVPANSTLVFNVKLVKVEPAPAAEMPAPQAE